MSQEKITLKIGLDNTSKDLLDTAMRGFVEIKSQVDIDIVQLIIQMAQVKATQEHNAALESLLSLYGSRSWRG